MFRIKPLNLVTYWCDHVCCRPFLQLACLHLMMDSIVHGLINFGKCGVIRLVFSMPHLVWQTDPLCLLVVDCTTDEGAGCTV